MLEALWESGMRRNPDDFLDWSDEELARKLAKDKKLFFGLSLK